MTISIDPIVFRMLLQEAKSEGIDPSNLLSECLKIVLGLREVERVTLHQVSREIYHSRTGWN